MPRVEVVEHPNWKTVRFRCPGCLRNHSVQTGDIDYAWGWNGDAERPTFTPSVKVSGVVPMTDEQHAAWMRGEPLPEPEPFVCHSYITNGRVEFLADCTHGLAGQTLDLPEVDSWR